MQEGLDALDEIKWHFYHGIIEQSRMKWKKLLQAMCSNPLLSYGHLEQIAQEHIQAVFKTIHGKNSTASLGNLCHLGHHHGKKVLPDVQRTFSCASACAYFLLFSFWAPDYLFAPFSGVCIF